MGAGSWGTAYAKVLCDAGTDTVLWARRPELAEQIRATRQNPLYLPGVDLPAGLAVTADPAIALEGADLVALALPSQHVRVLLTGWAELLPVGQLLVSLMKGVELGSGKRMSEVMAEATGAAPDRVAVVTGPNLAAEIAAMQPAATVVACTDPRAAEVVQRATTTAYFRPYTNTDVVGCELGGAVKNVIALAVGMAEGMGFGDNTRASLITRGLAETARLGSVLGADPRTFSGLAGLGDLVATCSSRLSRNRTVGERIGRGESIETVMNRMARTVEGVLSSRSILDLAGIYGVDMPITEHVVRVVHDGMRPQDMVRSIMSRDVRPE